MKLGILAFSLTSLTCALALNFVPSQSRADVDCVQVEAALSVAADKMFALKDPVASCEATEAFISMAQDRENEACSDQSWYPDERYLVDLDQECH